MKIIEERLQEQVEAAFKSINKQMDAHLVESIISLFNEGVLVHYVRIPRAKLDTDNFKMSVEAANSVKFRGREKIIEMKKEIETLKKGYKILKSANMFYADDSVEIIEANKLMEEF